jgi:hypothetical protein
MQLGRCAHSKQFRRVKWSLQPNSRIFESRVQDRSAALAERCTRWGLHAVLCGTSRNIRLRLMKKRILLIFIVWAISAGRTMNHCANHLTVA